MKKISYWLVVYENLATLSLETNDTIVEVSFDIDENDTKELIKTKYSDALNEAFKLFEEDKNK